ncbi:serine/threonine protein kinase [Paenibacillus marinisediminis]
MYDDERRREEQMGTTGTRMPSCLARGMLFQGRYRIARLIGSGGMSYVYAASDERLMGKQWAIKESIPLDYDRDHLFREAQWLTALRHANLPIIVDFFPPDASGHAYLVMELIEGETLAERVKSKQISLQEAVSIALQLCDALQYLHQQHPPIIYRDLKPSNVMLTSEGTVKLIDFGIARQHDVRADSDTVKLGTIGFAAPEQYEGRQSDARTDLYAVGAILAYMLTGGKWCGTVRFRSEMVHEAADEEFGNIIVKLLSPRPENRYGSASELMEEIRAYSESRFQNTNRHGTVNARHEELPNRHNSLSQLSRSQGAVVALLGASSGLGTTHAALTIAHAAARLFKGKVAYVDAAGQHSATVAALNRVMDSADIEIRSEQPYLCNSVHHIHLSGEEQGKYGGNHRIDNLMPQWQSQYDLIVLDLGEGQESYRMIEFMRASSSWLIGSAAPWRLQHLSGTLTYLQECNYKRWNYLVPHASMNSLRMHPARPACQRVIGFPTCLDPFNGNAAIDQWMLKWILPSSTLKPRYWLRRWLHHRSKSSAQREAAQ